MKRILTYTMTYVFTIIGLIGFLGICEGQRVQFGGTQLDPSMSYLGNMESKDKDDTELGDHVSIKENENTILVKLLGVFGLDNSIEKGRDLKFIDYARAIINIALGLVAFIALIMSLYTFYMMFFTENEAGVKKAKGNLVGIFIALGVLGLAWIIVSFIFWRYQSNWKAEEQNLFPGLESLNYTDSTPNDQIYLTI